MILIGVACSDDVRITTVGSSVPKNADDFKIESSPNLTTREDYILEWSEFSPAATYGAIVAKNPDCSDEVLDKKDLKERKLNLDFLSDGQYYLCVYTIIKNKKFE